MIITSCTTYETNHEPATTACTRALKVKPITTTPTQGRLFDFRPSAKISCTHVQRGEKARSISAVDAAMAEAFGDGRSSHAIMQQRCCTLGNYCFRGTDR